MASSLCQHALDRWGRGFAVLLLAALAGQQASAAPPTVMLSGPMPFVSTSRPAPAPDSGFQPAPTPDPDAANPNIRLGPGQPQWDASLQGVRRPSLRPGAGSSNATDFSENLQRRRGGGNDAIAPMLSLKMPLQ